MSRGSIYVSNVLLLCGMLLFSSAIGFANAKDSSGPIRIGIVAFLGGAGSVGLPIRNGTQLIVDAINDGTLPPPFNSAGLGGRAVEVVFTDEAGGPTRQTTEFVNLVRQRNVDIVVGYMSSGDCAAVGPMAEKLKILTVFATCANSLLEEQSYRYVFQTIALPQPHNVGLARYVASRFPHIKTVASIGPGYVWGYDTTSAFIGSLSVFLPSIQVVDQQWPKLFAGKYGAEISAMTLARPDLIHSSLWGGDEVAFIQQASARGLFKRSKIAFSSGLHILPVVGSSLPDGTLISELGPHGLFAPDTPIANWFAKTYSARYGMADDPISGQYAEALLAVKAAFDKAGTTSGVSPTIEQVIDAFEYLEWEGPSGITKMALGNGHQAISRTAVGVSRFDKAKGQVVLDDVVHYDAECVNPPAGWKVKNWIAAGFPGAKCN
jgi:branched-chain amino acid transport system substrate-binding protein